MSSACFEPDGSSSGRRLYIQGWYSVFYMYRYKQPQIAYTDAFKIQYNIMSSRR